MRSHRHLDQVGPLTSTHFRLAFLAAALLVTTGSAQNEDPLAARSKGASSAPVTVYEMADFQCPACRLFSVTVLPILERSEEHTSELQSRPHLVCRLLLEKKKTKSITTRSTVNNQNDFREADSCAT